VLDEIQVHLREKENKAIRKVIARRIIQGILDNKGETDMLENLIILTVPWEGRSVSLSFLVEDLLNALCRNENLLEFLASQSISV